MNIKRKPIRFFGKLCFFIQEVWNTGTKTHMPIKMKRKDQTFYGIEEGKRSRRRGRGRR
jgi:hypothetical protein